MEREPDLDADQLGELWAGVLRVALLDLRESRGAAFTSAVAFFTAPGSTLDLVAEALSLDADFLVSCARRLLRQRFGVLEAAQLLGEPLVRPRRRRRRAA